MVSRSMATVSLSRLITRASRSWWCLQLAGRVPRRSLPERKVQISTVSVVNPRGPERSWDWHPETPSGSECHCDTSATGTVNHPRRPSPSSLAVNGALDARAVVSSGGASGRGLDGSLERADGVPLVRQALRCWFPKSPRVLMPWPATAAACTGAGTTPTGSQVMPRNTPPDGRD